MSPKSKIWGDTSEGDLVIHLLGEITISPIILY